MRTSPEGIAVMHYFEDCKLLAYPDPASPLFKSLTKAGIDPYNINVVPPTFERLSGAPWTIGYGDTGPDVIPGLVITKKEANDRFARRLSREFEPAVSANVIRLMKQCEFDAWVCFTYNVGVRAFKGSTALRKFNMGDVPAAFDAITWWNKAGGQRMKGLDRRRTAEQFLGLGQSAKQAIALALKAFP